VIALVDLDDGPRMIGNIVGCAPEHLKIGMAIDVCFDIIDDMPLTTFRPRGSP
jgi:uncharacterized protein